jgi:ribosomal-protein-alanine N-acetyltransferase
MVKHMLEILTHEKEMHRIEAYIHPQNISSINLVKSLGFISEGTAYSYVKLNGSWQDHLRFVYIS